MLLPKPVDKISMTSRLWRTTVNGHFLLRLQYNCPVFPSNIQDRRRSAPVTVPLIFWFCFAEIVICSVRRNSPMGDYQNIWLTGEHLNLAWVSGVSGEKGKDGSENWREVKERNAWQMLLLEPSTPTQHDSIPSNQNHFRSLGCQLHVSKSSPKINLTLRSGRAPVLVLLRFRFFLKPPMRSFRILVL